MTRFARAKGSKASNERTPEDATSWSEMKQQLIDKTKQLDESKQKQVADQQRQTNYTKFLEQVEEEKSKNTKWAEFPTKPPKNQEEKITKPQKNVTKSVPTKRKNKQTEPCSKVAKKKLKIKKNPEDLTEEELKKIEKKKEKHLRQIEKRKLLIQKKEVKAKPERRKKMQETMIINGKEVEVAYMDGFPIKKEDCERIQVLRRQMIAKGLPRSEIKIALKLERRRAEKAFAREKKKVCFNCRKSGHNLSECPEVGQQQLAESSGTGICFKCGSTEHTHFECKVVRGQEFKFAQCFICNEQGHIARQCPDNARGLYPKGGACRVCGDVTHLKKDCPKFQAQQSHLQIETLDGGNPDNLQSNNNQIDIVNKRPNKIIKF